MQKPVHRHINRIQIAGDSLRESYCPMHLMLQGDHPAKLLYYTALRALPLDDGQACLGGEGLQPEIDFQIRHKDH